MEAELEVRGIDDLMPAILWNQYFLKVQGYNVKENLILLTQNGKASSIKCSKHIVIRYFFVTDHIKGSCEFGVWSGVRQWK